MDQTPLVDDLIESGADFLEEFGKHYPVAVAYWLKDRDERKWRLHIASEKFSDGKTREAYGEVLRITGQMKDVCFDPFNVKLRKLDDPIARFARDYQRPYPARPTMIHDVPSFYGAEFEGMYLYPYVKAATA